MEKSESSSYRIEGRVIERVTGQGLAGLRVEAWDKDLLSDDLLGQEITNAQGRFIIRFSQSDFDKLYGDKRPDIFFKVFQNNQLIKSTEDSVLWNIDREDINVTIEVESVDGNNIPETQPSKQGSTRSVLQATYTPRKPQKKETTLPGRGVEKAAFIKKLAPTIQELSVLSKNYQRRIKQQNNCQLPDLDKVIRATGVILTALRNRGNINAFQSVKHFSSLDVDVLVRIANDLIALRRKTAASLEQIQKLEQLQTLVEANEENLSTAPVGYIHLERLSFTPAGIERGELVYSVPLSPGEEVNISHKEWSNTSEEFERIVTDYMEEYSEEGVTEKSELAQSVNSQNQHSSAINVGATLSGSYSGVQFSTSFGYNASSSASKSEQLSRNHSAEITGKASSRSKQEHKMSFKVASAAGTEDQTVRLIKNPFQDKAIRVDYYQLIRKWRVDLFRYGIRLAWDIVVPEPGSGLLAKISEIRHLKETLQTPFVFPYNISVITREGYKTIAAIYGVDPQDPPIDNPPAISGHWEKDWHDNADEAEKATWVSMPLNIENTYKIEEFWVDVGFHEMGQGIVAIAEVQVATPKGLWRKNCIPDGGITTPPIEELKGISAPVEFVFRFVGLHWVWATVIVKQTLKDEAFTTWQLNTYKQLYDAAYAQDVEMRIRLKERLSRLEEELGAQDSLSLRKKEREEVMRITLESLGKDPTDIYGDEKAIKLIHQAIEWENILYFLYPYFWSDPNKQLGYQRKFGEADENESYWEFKKYLDHPDPLHRAFLKAGAARVVMTIRPGFEDAFLAFINGYSDDLLDAPYLSISEEFKAFAQTNYPGIPPANPIENVRPQVHLKQKRAWQEMLWIMRLLEEFQSTNHGYPTRNEGLSALQNFFPLKDPWGNPYNYQCPSTYPDKRDYDLYSFGANGESGGEGENADLKNWEYDPLALRSRERVKAWADMQMYIEQLEKFYQLHGRYPNTEEGLKALWQVLPLTDPWGNPYAYKSPGDYGEYDLVSYGADGKPGGEGLDADIPSWAEASLIGTWYEYTPTSALDIEFDKKMPKP